MQELVLLGLFVLALYYLYRKLIRNRGCNCGGKGGGCASSAKQPSCADEKE